MAIVELPLLHRQAYVDGRWVDSDSGETFPVVNPATGETIAEVPRMGAAETRRAIEAAERALPGWRNRTAKERARVLRRLADLMAEHEDDLARLLVTEQGKPLAEARIEIAYSASFYEWFGEEAKRVYGDTIPADARDRRITVLKQPVGVTAGITPWQTCIAANRILVQDGVYDDFLARFTDRVRVLKVADGFTDGVDVGPLIDEPALEKIERHVADALDRGAELLAGGEGLGGQFYAASVLAGVPADAAMSREETFGPVAGIARFASEVEAVRAANDTPYGLAAYFYSGSLGRVTRVSEALEYGIVGINTGLISTEVAPFGGMKESGIGREGSSYGIDEWLELKYLCVGGVGEPIA